MQLQGHPDVIPGPAPVHATLAQPAAGADALKDFVFRTLSLYSLVSHFIGKGHLGYQTTDHLPINRGFSSHVGYLAAWESYQYGNNMGCGKNASEATYLRKDFWHDHQPGEDVVDEINYSSNYYTSREPSPTWIS